MEPAIGREIQKTEEAVLAELRQVRRGARGSTGAITTPPLTAP